MKYANQVIEEKFNRLEKNKKEPATADPERNELLRHSMHDKKYDGQYSSRKIEAIAIKESLKSKKKVKQKLNAPLKSFERKNTGQWATIKANSWV